MGLPVNSMGIDIQNMKKEIAISSMLKLEVGKPLRINLEELKHGAARILCRKEYKGYIPIWNPWATMTDPNRLIHIKEWAKQEINKHAWESDYICGISNTGIALSTLLCIDLNKNLYMSDNTTYKFVPHTPKVDNKGLLIDSVIVSGYHLLNNTKRLGENLVGIITIALDDFEEERLPIVDTWIKDNKISCFFKYSELYNWWKENIEEIQEFNFTEFL